jgi:ribonuclease P protein component
VHSRRGAGSEGRSARLYFSPRDGPVRAHVHEAHLPAQEAQARTHARVSRAVAHARRTANPQAQAGKGPAPAHAVGVAADGERTTARGGRRRRPGRHRLTRSADFDRVYRQGRSRANRYLVVYAFPSATTDAGSRLGVSVGRKVGGAVERNRVKRLLREAFSACAELAPDGHDFVVVARPPAGDRARDDGEPGIERALRELVSELGPMADGGAA